MGAKFKGNLKKKILPNYIIYFLVKYIISQHSKLAMVVITVRE